MAEETTTEVTEETTSTETEGKEELKDQKVPYTRFEEVNKARKKLEGELEEMREKILEFEDRDKSELQRERDRAVRAETALEQLSGKVTSMEKGSWVRSAAAELNFHDPEDAVARIDLSKLEDEREALKAVKGLAKAKEHLVRKPQKETTRPQIGKLFGADNNEGGQRSDVTMTPAQAAAQAAAEEERQFAEGLREKLAQFKDNWHEAGPVV
jgi:hypothetical protein